MAGRLAADSGLYAVRRVDQSQFPPEWQPIEVTAPVESAAAPVRTTDDGSQIDLLVAYTANAQAQVGGAAAMQALINLAVAETNAAYGNSGVTQRLRLVHTAAVAYPEGDFGTDLNRLAGSADGYTILLQPRRQLQRPAHRRGCGRSQFGPQRAVAQQHGVACGQLPGGRQHRDSDPHADAHAHGHADPDPYANRDAHADRDGNQDGYCHGHPHAHGDDNTDEHARATDRDRDEHRQPNPSRQQSAHPTPDAHQRRRHGFAAADGNPRRPADLAAIHSASGPVRRRGRW